MTRQRAAIAAAVALAVLTVTAAPASAATLGGEVFNRHYSDSYIDVTNERGAVLRLQPDRGSDAYPAFANVQSFRVKSGCVARSQWGYDYKGGITWKMSGSNVYLGLNVICPLWV